MKFTTRREQLSFCNREVAARALGSVLADHELDGVQHDVGVETGRNAATRLEGFRTLNRVTKRDGGKAQDG